MLRCEVKEAADAASFLFAYFSMEALRTLASFARTVQRLRFSLYNLKFPKGLQPDRHAA